MGEYRPVSPYEVELDRTVAECFVFSLGFMSLVREVFYIVYISYTAWIRRVAYDWATTVNQLRLCWEILAQIHLWQKYEEVDTWNASLHRAYIGTLGLLIPSTESYWAIYILLLKRYLPPLAWFGMPHFRLKFNRTLKKSEPLKMPIVYVFECKV